ncbi:FeoA family protein [Helicobacter baculiformis]|uniref:FeoA family protein n=1 Tax=Helicobacter baculiformis TaxID=427351 RepID=A0ABV7ZGZ4_9HELI|nr:FeoA family protein [Helicobacter baculiformis]
MTLLDCQKDQRYTILEIQGNDSALKDRFLSFGVHAGVEFTLLHHSLRRATFSIAINNAQVALRAHEAELLVVAPL